MTNRHDRLRGLAVTSRPYGRWTRLLTARKKPPAEPEREVDRWDSGRSFECRIGTRLVKGIAADIYARNEVLRRAGAAEHASTRYEASDDFADIGNYDGRLVSQTRPSDEEIDRVLASCRPPGLIAQLEAIAARIPREPALMKAFLAAQASELNAAAPQVPSPRRFDDEINSPIRGFGCWAEWIDPRLVVSTEQPVWNQFDRAHESVPNIVGGLASAIDTAGGIERWLYEMYARTGSISLLRIEGPAGPIYEVNRDGNHRVHAARMLAVPWILAEVDVSSLPAPRRPSRGVEPRWRELRDRGAIDADVRQGRWFFRGVTAEWLLSDAATAEQVSAAYERCYPGALAQMGDPGSPS
jgi:hypothetical protein